MAADMKGKIPDAWTDAEDRSLLKLLCENPCFGMMGISHVYWTNPTKHVRLVDTSVALQVSSRTRVSSAVPSPLPTPDAPVTRARARLLLVFVPTARRLDPRLSVGPQSMGVVHD